MKATWAPSNIFQVQNITMGFKLAAKTFNVPKTTLIRRLANEKISSKGDLGGRWPTFPIYVKSEIAQLFWHNNQWFTKTGICGGQSRSYSFYIGGEVGFFYLIGLEEESFIEGDTEGKKIECHAQKHSFKFKKWCFGFFNSLFVLAISKSIFTHRLLFCPLLLKWL